MSLSKKDTMKKHDVKDSSMGNFRVKLGQKYGQPERSKREDINWYGMKAIIDSEGICHFENGISKDLNQPIDDAVL
jgi:hypothetical protein